MGTPPDVAAPALTPAWRTALRQLDVQPTYAGYAAAAGSLARVSPEDTGLPPLRVAVLRNFTLDPLLPVLRGEIARAGFHPVLHLGEFDAIMPEVLGEGSALYDFGPDLIVVAQWLETLAPALVTRFVSLSADQVDAEVERVLSHCEQLVAAVRRRTAAPMLLNNFPLPLHPTLGILDAQGEGYHTHTILRLNRELLRRVRAFGDVYLVDYLSVFARVGGLAATDERHWQIARAPLGRAALVPLGQEYGRFVRALRGKSRKCLVLDCDNTLWGGVVGEDGLEGIQLGSTHPGSSFVDFQRELVNLYHRGVILAVCSKNNDADVREVFLRHPDMVLREEHVAAWQVNWSDKATNIRQIARDLNIGLDSLVFVDDSSFECGLVQDQLPEVAVVSLEGDPSGFRARLSAQGYFDSLTLSAEDRERGRLYASERHRRELQQSSGSLEDYLTRLGLVAELARADEQTIPRVSQLTQKTNQFNLTTRRYAEGEIRALAADPEVDVLCLTLRDKVASLGLIGVAIVRYAGAEASIDTLLMSCRALGRGAEDTLLATVMTRAAERGCRRVLGRYEPTKKNEMVAEFYPTHGFRPTGGGNGRGTGWERELADASIAPPSWITVVSHLER